MGATITKYNALCNLGYNIDEIYKNALNGIDTRFEITTEIIKGKSVRLGKVDFPLREIKEKDYNIRCNKLLQAVFESLNIESVISKYGAENIGVVCATTNTGVDDYALTRNPMHAKISNPAEFIRHKYRLKNYYTSVSTACSSGIKAFTIAKELLETNFSKAVIVVGTDGLSRVPIFGFYSLEILSSEPSDPFGKNRSGINLGEAAAVFVVEKDLPGIEILSTAETTDSYHATTPEPEGIEAQKAIRLALNGINPEEVDYINLHGTGTPANDLMEGRAIYEIFKDKTPASSTKPLTGHCLGAAAGIETALCCKLIESRTNQVFPHIYDGEYDNNIPYIKLTKAGVNYAKNYINTCLCTSFGFGGTNTAAVLRRANV